MVSSKLKSNLDHYDNYYYFYYFFSLKEILYSYVTVYL